MSATTLALEMALLARFCDVFLEARDDLEEKRSERLKHKRQLGHTQESEACIVVHYVNAVSR